MGSSLVENIFFMLGGIAVMMFGMKFMGSNLEQVAGNNMKKMLGKMTTNRFAGVGVGATVTAIINSSTATTVMLVGFVNIGLMNLAQATSVIMGANIGTTITAQILSLTGTGFEVAAYASLIAALGMVLTMTAKKDKVKITGYILLGVGMIFLGLKIMSSSVRGIIYEDYSKRQLKGIFENIFQKDHFPLILMVIGIILTALVQSSAAITGILISLGPAITFQNAVFVILGSNIGTCITSIISSIGTNTNAKRTAVIHLLFNLFGCLIFIVPVWIWNAEIATFMENVSGSMERQIANFHTIFNLITTIVLIPFISVLVKLAEKIIPSDKVAVDKKHSLTFLDDRLLNTPPIAVGNIKNEVMKMAEIARENINLSINMLLDDSINPQEDIKENENTLNFLAKGITAFLTRLMGKELTRQDEKKVGSYYHVVSDVERVGDYAENIMEYAERLRVIGVNFSDDAKNELREMVDIINHLLDVSLVAFGNRDLNELQKVDELEEKTDEYARRLEGYHIERLKKGLCTAELGSIYLQTVSNLERVGDHITNLAFSIKQYESAPKA